MSRYSVLVLTMLIMCACTNHGRYIGMERQELASRSGIQFGYGGTYSYGYSTENIAIKGALKVATFKIVGAELKNKADILVSLESVEKALKK